MPHVRPPLRVDYDHTRAPLAPKRSPAAGPAVRYREVLPIRPSTRQSRQGGRRYVQS